MAYVRSPLPNTAISFAPARASNPPKPSKTAETGAGLAGSVTSIIWTALSFQAATRAYVRPSLPNTTTSFAPARASNPPKPSKTAETGAGLAGSVTSIIWVPSSLLFQTVTMAYVRFPFSNTATPVTPLRVANPSEPPKTAETGAGLAGSVTSMIWTASSSKAATMAYVRFPLPNTSTSFAPSKASNPPEPSKTAETGLGPDITELACLAVGWVS